MSFLLQPEAPSRLNRCQIFGPGSRPELFEKMANSEADVVNLDLEDSVSPSDKKKARANIVEAIKEIDWREKTLSVRINGLDTEFWHQDIIELLTGDTERLDCLMIPKAGCYSDVYAIDALVTTLEKEQKRRKKINFEVIIETAAGIENVYEIAKSSKRLVAMSLGAADYAASMGMQTTGIGGTQENYYMISKPNESGIESTVSFADPWHFPTVKIVSACRASGILPVDGPFGDISDDAGFIAQAKRSATLGMVGKWAIHPKQVSLANSVFSPSPSQIEEALDIIKLMETAKSTGRGAVVYKGRLIDIASIKQANVIINQAEKIAKMEST